MKKILIVVGILCVGAFLIRSVYSTRPQKTLNVKKELSALQSNKEGKYKNPNEGVDYSKAKLETIYMAGGCFWGLEGYMSRIYGVADAISGYANGSTQNPKYEEIRKTGHAETVKVVYDPEKISLRDLMLYYLKVVDPTSINKQGNDRGTQYRSGIYYNNETEKDIIETVLAKEQEKYDKKIAIEVEPLKGFYEAEEYHQDYLEKNPNGYCHIDLRQADEPLIDPDKYKKVSPQEAKKSLNTLQYNVAYNNATEKPFENEYDAHFEKGIYVDVTSGEPLFSSTDKFDSGCGWPSFSKPIQKDLIEYKEDTTLGMKRVEVRSRVGDIHLGHVFEDAPDQETGLRYCINSASLRFVPLEKMEEEGYGYLIPLVEEK